MAFSLLIHHCESQSVLVAVYCRPRTGDLLKETKAMNTVITNIVGSLKLGERTWLGLIAVSMMVGLLAAIAVPVYVH